MAPRLDALMLETEAQPSLRWPFPRAWLVETKVT